MLMSWAVTIALRDRSWIGTQWAAFWADLIYFVALTAIALKTRKFWPLFAAGFQLLCVLTHLGRMIDPKVHAWAYASAQVIWTDLVLMAIGSGVVTHWLSTRPRASDAGVSHIRRAESRIRRRAAASSAQPLHRPTKSR